MSETPSSEAWTYTFDWRTDEHAGVTSLLVREQFDSGVRRAMKWGVVLVLALGAVVAVATALSGSLAEAMPLGFLVIAVAALVLAFGRLAGWIQAWQLKRHDPNVAHPITHSLDESGFHTLFMFYYSSRLAYYLPKRALPNLEEVVELRTWIRAQLPLEVTYVEG
jgi:hypothetical protein